MYKFLLLCIEVPIILKLRVILFILNLINILMNSLDTQLNSYDLKALVQFIKLLQ